MQATLPTALSQDGIEAADVLRRRVGRALLRNTPERYEGGRRPRGAQLVHALQSSQQLNSAIPSSPLHFPGLIIPGDS